MAHASCEGFYTFIYLFKINVAISLQFQCTVTVWAKAICNCFQMWQWLEGEKKEAGEQITVYCYFGLTSNPLFQKIKCN